MEFAVDCELLLSCSRTPTSGRGRRIFPYFFQISSWTLAFSQESTNSQLAAMSLISPLMKEPIPEPTMTFLGPRNPEGRHTDASGWWQACEAGVGCVRSSCEAGPEAVRQSQCCQGTGWNQPRQCQASLRVAMVCADAKCEVQAVPTQPGNPGWHPSPSLK